ncbi:thrombospondin type-1 domain-containing protein 7B [Electrophorus electricus]|uniref:thrombospondin type-1 domain-containing protein 7B n=1 Tax=Electrophorus electricus TaxID=8005 RepID=UPI0015D04087|nr:thrombospondin type-1 domain-containing protein 7B [Electrophorus electricus]
MCFLTHVLASASTIQPGPVLCLVLMTAAVATDRTRRSPFSWKTGAWGVCIAEECGSAGLQFRSVWCAHTEGWNTHQSSCPPRQRPAQQRACVKVCEWQQQVFEWRPSPWGPCTPSGASPPADGCVTAQRGLQRRSVTCARRSNRTSVSPQACEAFAPVPELEQACLLPCPLDCVVSTFSHWSPCSRTCGPALQHRTRKVLAPPLYGGAECPGLTQTRPCGHYSTHPALCPSDQQEHSYSLWAGPWSACRRKGTAPIGRTTVDFSSGMTGLKTPKPSYAVKGHSEIIDFQRHPSDQDTNPRASWDVQIGYQTRQLRCTHSNGKNAMLSLCDHHSTPVNFRSCVMPKNCEVSDWSTWSSCSKTCRTSDQSPGFRHRKRHVMRAPVGEGETCPSLEDVEACHTLENLLPPCPRYDWKVTNWGPCQVGPLLSQQDRRQGNNSILCGGGIQTRDAYCVRNPDSSTKARVSRPVGQSLCTGLLPPLTQPCSIPCSKPCRLSPWSPWGPCLLDNSLEHHQQKGFKLRMRSIVEEAQGESESCPQVTEEVTCDEPVSFLLRMTSRGPCVPLEGVCGPGAQEQSAACVTITGETVPSVRCPGVPPPSRLACEVPCPGDCVLGDWGPWSPWSPCSHLCSSERVQEIQARTRSVFAPPGEKRKGCLPAPVLEQWRPCSIQPCLLYYWDMAAWGPCTIDPSTDRNASVQKEVEERTCGTGAQTRQVTCRRLGQGQVESQWCPDSTRPNHVRFCALPCKVDCIVTPFSEWSLCPTSCSPLNATVSTQSRYRIVIQRPANGGQHCPATVFEERECKPRPLCPTYRWQTHIWHHCVLVPDWVRQAMGRHTEPCGLGLETRTVTCVRMDNTPADIAECMQWSGAMPTTVRQCRVACRDDCRFSSWTRFSRCQGCGSWRIRTRSLTGRSRRHRLCQQAALVEKEACPCSKPQTRPHGPWSQCLLAPFSQHTGYAPTQRAQRQGQGVTLGWQDQTPSKACGQGWSYRALACLDHQGHLCEPALCNSSGIEEEVCLVPCPLDCRLSEWSAWSPCSAPCGGGVKMRSRWLREKPFNGGRPCPKLDFRNQAQVSEVVPCYSECDRYVWEAEPWSVCTIDPPPTLNTSTAPIRRTCGDGVRTRRIRCVRKEAGRIVDGSLCGQDEMPVTTQTCLLPCPSHCVTSEWSQWSECPMGCNEREFRWRSKTVLRRPGSGHTCPELNQTQSCASTTCLTHSYAFSDWSTCQLSDRALCGQGTKSRLLNCIRSDGKLVELSRCKEWGPSRGRLSAPCEVSCPVDCLLTDWSPWSECSHTCGAQSKMTRSRVVLQQAVEGGRPCSSQLSQTKACPIRPCYSWELGEWSACTVEGAHCGEGVRERNLSCMVHWGSAPSIPLPKVVQEERCTVGGLSKAMEVELRQSCSIPCPGDCHLTEWSPWSTCQLPCLDGRSFETRGQQARSRAVVIQVPESRDSCPSQVYETRACHRGACFSYEWVTGGWLDMKREVWCRRSDGLNVTGGCLPQKKPPSGRGCHPLCAKPFSFCTQSGVCVCEKGYTEVMTSHGFLDYCTKTPGADHKKAEAKNGEGRPRRGHMQDQSGLGGWALQPVGPDGRIRLWVYTLMVVGFLMVLLIITMSFLLCKSPKDSPNACSSQKALTFAYDGDADM